MKITQVISDSNIGGAGVLLSLISGGLCQKYDTEIILPRGSDLTARLPRSGVKITELDISKDKSFSLADTITLLRYFRTARPDIIHSHATLSARLAGRLLGKCVLISTRHCAKSDANKEYGVIRKRLYSALTDLTVSTADCATQNLIDEGVGRDRIFTIKNGTSPLRKSSESENLALRRELGIAPSDFIIGSCARLETVKGHDLLLRAAVGLIARIPNISLLIVGDGSRADALKKQAARLGIAGKCIFTGFKNNPAPYQNLFYVNVNTSRGTETSCLATSECMSLGIPSVVSDFGGNKEQIKDGVNGLIFPSDDYMALEETLYKILSDKELYSRLSCGARDIFEREFSLSVMLSRYEKLYNSLKY